MNNINNSDVNLNSSWQSPWLWAVPVISVIGFCVIWLTGLNQDLFITINSWGRGSFTGILWANLTILGDTLIAITLLSFFVRHRPEIIWALLIAAVFATLWVHGIKPVAEHLRPGAVLSNDVINIIGVTLHKGSFPSGHTTTAFTFAGVICLLRAHPAVMIAAILLAILAGTSRVVVGAHWPMDVFAGAFGGWLSAYIGVFLFNKLAQQKNWGEQIPGKKIFNSLLALAAGSLLVYENGYPGSHFFQLAIAVMCLIFIFYNFWYFSQQVQHQQKQQGE